MKRFSCILLAAALIVSSVFSGGMTIKAESSGWQREALISPENGELVGAGYINIDINTSLENAVKYEVFFDGKNECQLADGTDAVMSFEAKADVTQWRCEVYTTEVSTHSVYVTATLSDGNIVTSDIFTFYVSKKGVAIGADMSSAVNLNDMNCAWYYNWATNSYNSIVDNYGKIQVAPMVWGAEHITEVDSITSKDPYLIGFNEPDLEAQANMSVEDALKLWPDMVNTGRRLVSPVMASNGRWLKAFLDGVDADEQLRCDAIATHFYAITPSVNNAKAALAQIDNLYELYHKPIWLTEFAIWGFTKETSDNSYENLEARKGVEEFMKALVQGLEERPYVERYSWFPYNIHSANEIDSAAYSGASALFDYDTGAITRLGEIYAGLGNPEGYRLAEITNKYVEPQKETTTAPVTTTKQPVTTQKATMTSALKPTRVSVKKPVNIKRKSVKLSWKKAKRAKKYQIQYSLNKKFKKAKKYKTKTISTAKLKYTVKKLTKKKKYYFRVRGVNGKSYGAWSKIKSVVIKK